jgi:hypothetical protein
MNAKEKYISAVQTYASYIKDNFFALKALNKEINKAGIDIFGETQRGKNGSYRNGYLPFITNSIMNEAESIENNTLVNTNSFQESDISFKAFTYDGYKNQYTEMMGNVNEEELINTRFSDAWGFSILVDISNPDAPVYVPTANFEELTDSNNGREGFLWTDVEKLPTLSNDRNIIGLTYETEGSVHIWFPIPSNAAGGKRKSKRKTRRAKTKKTRKARKSRKY